MQGTPQTFSVYVLKKIEKRRRPKRFETHVSKSSSGLRGARRAARKLRPQRKLSNGPRPKNASNGLSG